MRRVLSGLALSLSTLAAMVLLLEAALRLMGVGSDATIMEHPRAGWVHIPGRHAQVESEDPSLGRQIRIDFDSLGLRDIERTAAKAPGVFRVLVMGDSYVEGMQVPLDSTLTRRLERGLDRRDGRRVEVWNCGVAGYTTSNELLYLRHEARRFRPDLVVLCFLSGNDLADQVPELATSLRNRPFFRRRGDALVLDRSYFRTDLPLIGWVRSHSRLFPWVKRQLTLVRRNAHRETPPHAESAGAASLPLDLQIYAERPDSLWVQAWDLTERLLLETREEARRAGAGFLLVSISNGVQESAEARRNRPSWTGWIDRAGISMDWPETRLGTFSARNGIEYLPLLPAFRDEAERTGRPLHIAWTGHWNSAGHALAARVIGERIEHSLDPVAGRPQAVPPP